MKNSVPQRLVRTNALVAGIAMGIAGYSSVVPAQDKTPLPGLPGLTEVQKPVASAIDTVCPNLLGSGVNPKQDGTPRERLTFSCTAMVVTSAFLQPDKNPFDQATGDSFDLRIGNEQLRKYVQDSGPVQHNAQNQISTTAARTNLLAARLFDLRAGARGLSVSMNGVDAPGIARSQAGTEAAPNATGGAASADSQFAGRLSGFVKVAGNWGKVDETTLQDAYKYDSYSILGGIDYRVSDALILGGAVSYEDTKSRFDNSLGEVKAQTWSVTGYGTYSMGPWYFDGFVSYGNVDYDTTRTILIPSNNPNIPTVTGSATASPRGDQWSLSIGTGYNYPLAAGSALIPFARLGYIHVKNKSFSESESVTGLGLAVDGRTVDSLQSALGATVSTTVNTSMGVFIPYFTAQWMHEFKNDSPSIVAKFVNDPLNFNFAIPTSEPTRDYAVFIVGSSGTFANGLSGFLQFGAAAGLKDATNYSVVAGLRKEF